MRLRLYPPLLSVCSLTAFVLWMATGLYAQPAPTSPLQKPREFSASSILVERIVPPEDLLMPEDTRISIYENVISELIKTKIFKHVYRSGDRQADTAPDLITLRLTPEVFKPGSQKEREVITIAGATSIQVRLEFIARDGKVSLEKVVNGKVRFYGENLRATYDLAKKVGKVVEKSF